MSAIAPAGFLYNNGGAATRTCYATGALTDTSQNPVASNPAYF